MTIAIVAILIIVMIVAHAAICRKLAWKQTTEAIKLMMQLQLEAIEQQDFNHANKLAWQIFAVDTDQHYRDLVIFRNPWHRYPAEVRLKLGQE